MKQNAGHIRLKVVISYILLIGIAVCSVAYIYNVIQRLAKEDEPDTIPRQKVYLITGALTRLYESEALSQLIGMDEKDFNRFNRTLTLAENDIDSLRLLVSDSVQILKIDTINNLLERKRLNTRQLLTTLKKVNTEHLYRQHIEKIIAVQDTVREQVKVEERVVEKKDTLYVNKPRRGFFKRLAEAFSPSEKDTNFVVNTTRQIMTDTVIQPFNPSDTILTVLKNIQDSVADQRRQLDAQLAVKAGSLRYNNSVLTRRINQMLRDIEQEEIDASMNRVEQRQRLLRETSRLMGFIAIAASLIAILFLFFILRDLSRSQYYRKQLEKAKKYAEDLLHSREKLMLTISHDIRAPLSSIIGYIELMENLGAGERQRYYLENMTGSANHILALMNDLLDFHRLESNQMEIKPVPFNIPMLFGEIYNSFRPIAENKGLDFVLNLREEYTKVQYMGDPIRIRQVVNNLLSNAIKFTPTGKVELLVSVGDKKDTSAVLSFSIVDAGPGIPWDEQEKIFGEFTRLTSTEGVEGFGLGLSITRKLIALMGGSLSLQSIPQKGSTFSVSLPLSVSDVRMTPHPVPEQAGKQYPVREIHCLLVDDDPLQLAMTEEMLSLNHIRVSCCTNPHDVLKRLQELPVDVVITDIQMPGMDGFLLLQQIRQSSVPNAATLPIIALSANLSKEDDHYISAGFTAFLNKPFTGKQLLNLINTLLYRETGEVKELNFSALTAFASDDAEASAHILSTFCRETRKNLALLQEALAGQNRELAAQTSHRLLPLFSMLKEADLSENLRVLEKQSNTLPDLEWRELIDSICARILFVVEHVESNNVE